MRFPAIALLLGSVAGALAATQSLSDPDMFWHLATGRETLAHGIVRTDLFSWTVRGAPVSTDQWLGQVLMYGAFAVGDWWAVAVLRVLEVTALVSLVALGASLTGARPLAIVLASLPALLLTRAVWVDRPELLGFVFFAALLVLLRVGREGRPSALIAVVVLIGFWASVHGSFALGVVLAVLVCAEGALRDVPRRRTYLACAAASVVVSFLTPAGLATWTAPGFHFLSPPRYIEEWGVVDLRTPLGIAYVLTLAGVIACALLGPRLALRDLVVLIPVALLSLTAARQAPLIAIAAAPLFAERIELLLEHVLVRRDRAAQGLGRALLLVVPVALLLAAIIAAPRSVDDRSYPADALSSIPSGDGTLARYEWGGWLIWRAPASPVFVDGRLTPYLGGIIDDYQRIVGAVPGWEDTVRRRGVRTLVVGPTDPVAIRAVELGWSVRFRSSDVVVIAVP
ncbi:MAG TPA: hypothetical protein VEP48_09760 [Methylomirabilota bacterium]|nr:hypothetical protein [Methylomirabilota bacterium]